MTLPRDAIVLTGLGMRTAVGNDATQTCATIRTRLSNFKAWPHGVIGMQEDGVVVAAVEPDLGDHPWTEVDEAMSAQPLHEALWQAKLHDGRELRAQRGTTRIGAWLATPAPGRAGIEPSHHRAFARRVPETCIRPATADRFELVEADNAAALISVQQAAAALREGEVSVAVIRAVDSHLHMPWLEQLDADRRLAQEDDPPGFIPGQAATCLVLERFDHAQSRGAIPLLSVDHVEVDNETTPIGPDHPIRAEALSRVVQRCLAPDPGAIRRVIADLNGERWRALEWGLVETRCFGRLSRGWRLWHAADSIGDVGAAAGAVAIGMAARAYARHYAEGGAVLVTCASLAGPRAAARLGPPPARS